MGDEPRLPSDLESVLVQIFDGPSALWEQEIDSLCRAHPQHAVAMRIAGRLMARNIAATRPEGETVPHTMTGDAPPDIGPYRIVRLLGEGGMGSVYLAQQTEPVSRQVALKVVKLGMDSATVLRRFELERRALAVMNHDSIARVFDCGTTQRGQPYFVMEYVPGTPLTDYCDAHRLPLRERLALFGLVCSAVQYAHQKGVVHRDLKPGNILVTEEGGRPVPKVIDFGLARATDQTLLQAGLATEVGMVMGTPEYMSPEQADPTAVDIDTRTDIYSLGVILYQLLVGRLPFSRDQLFRAGFMEMQRLIREVDPPRPSTRLSAIDDPLTTATARSTSVTSLRRQLRNDLDWIVLKSMEKRRERRYESASGLAADVQRYLDGEPVTAGPPSAAYRLRKLAWKYRGQIAAAGVVFLTAIGGAVIAVIYAQRAERNANQLAVAVGEFDQLAGVVRHDRAVFSEARLDPPWPERIPAITAWLNQDCNDVLRLRSSLVAAVQDLRGRALPTTTEAEGDLLTHPRAGELELLRGQAAALRAAQAQRDGAWLDLPALPDDVADQRAHVLNMIAWYRVAPDPKERKLYGDEAFGLACALAAQQKAADGDGTAALHQVLDTVVWANFANGRDEEATRAAAAALLAAPPAELAAHRKSSDDLARAIAAAAATLADVERRLATLTTEVGRRRTYRFASESQQFLHDNLAGLLDRLPSFESTQKARAEARLAWARRIDHFTRAHPRALVTWDQARSAIRRADGEAASELYRMSPVDIEPQIGLVPIGMNPVSKLWEFYDLRSAWDPASDVEALGTLEIPRHDPASGNIVAGEDTGIVFVLIPGGVATIGTQKTDQDREHYDPASYENEPPVHRVPLRPFFLGRHEITQGQWRRLTGGAAPSYYGPAAVTSTQPVTWAHPLEQVTWTEADSTLRAHGLCLPTEVQWEYACRAGSATVWQCGSESACLAGRANLADRAAHAVFGAAWVCDTSHDDGFAIHSPAGRFAPNAFGLHDMHGNVYEWCRDSFDGYELPARAGDGLRLVPSYAQYYTWRCYRGGSYQFVAERSRAGARRAQRADTRFAHLGARAARVVHPDR